MRKTRWTMALPIAAALVAGGGFLYMVKLMHDMTAHIGAMSAQVASMATDMHGMRADMASLAANVANIGVQVQTLPAIARDMGRMREGLEQMSGVLSPGQEQIQQMNPMGVIRQMLPDTGR